MSPTRTFLLSWVCLAAACSPPAEGTFVGNPSMSVRYVDNQVQHARGGQLVASEVFVTPCGEVDNVPLGPKAFHFEGAISPDELQLPPGEYCEIFFVVSDLNIRFDEGGANLTSVTANSFDLRLTERFQAVQNERLRLSLGDDTWLSTLAANTLPGENLVSPDNSALFDAFLSGLTDASSISPLLTPEPSLAGRLNLDGYPTSPLGTPTSVSSCGPSTTFDLAVPIPPATMATLGLTDGTVGWCEGTIDFPDPMVEHTSYQLDHSDGSSFPVSYNGWGQDCGALHCNQVYRSDGTPLDRSCSVLAFCDSNGEAVVTGYDW